MLVEFIVCTIDEAIGDLITSSLFNQCSSYQPLSNEVLPLRCLIPTKHVGNLPTLLVETMCHFQSPYVYFYGLVNDLCVE